MIRSLLFLPLVVFPAVSSASDAKQVEKFGYEHIHLDIGGGTTDEEWLDNSNVTSIGLGGNYLFSDNWLMNIDFSAQFFHPDNYTLRVDRLMAGAGYRYGINERFDVYGIYSLGAIKAKATDDETDKSLSSDSEFIHAFAVGGSYLVTEQLSATAEVKLNFSDIVDENIYKFAFNYQWHDVIGTGLYYQFRDTDYAGEKPGYINEVGLSFKFVY
ncbi:outer membrane beta-barrel protein [Vibrio mytili]|uniref:Membrane protein n=1 Tax=Vibrio mytili TaxID=50718 RepID=A0A0C3E960_9VIBR|nr:outer membrane beta-barrel protein [Vibrio mytili]KIN10933.1 membrane protein [Vibrio mytili]